MNWFKKVDHVTFVVSPETIDKWAKFYTEVMGGTLTLKIADTNPAEESGMMLYTIDFGNFGVALVAGLDRADMSHVTAFWLRHGEHSPQHVAVQVENLEKFMEHAQENGLKFLGETLVRKDEKGWVKQVFAKGFHDEENTIFEINFPVL